MFEFTNEKPSSERIWEEVNKQDIPTSAFPSDLLKTMLWILLCAGTDFKKSKESSNKVITGETSIDRFRQNFRNALLHNKVSAPIDVNPTSLSLPANLDVINVGSMKSLRLPIAVFKDIFIGSNADAVVALANRVFPGMDHYIIEDIRTDIAVLYNNDFTKLTPYSVSVMAENVMFTKKNFRTFFKPNPTPDDPLAASVSSKAELQKILRNTLISSVRADSTVTSITLPTYIKG